MKYYKKFIYLGLAVLCLTTIAIVQGQLPLGDFRPRFLLLILSMPMVHSLWHDNVMKPFCAFSIIVLFSQMFHGAFGFDSYVASFMEYAIPLLLGLSVLELNDESIFRAVSIYFLCYVVVSLLISINGCLLLPGSIRMMAAGIEYAGTSIVATYKALGICSFAFATMSMVFPIISIGVYKSCQSSKIKLASVIVAVMSFTLLYLAENTTPMLVAIFMSVFAVLSNKFSVRNILLASIVLVCFVPFIVSFLHSLNVFAGTNFESRIEDVFMVINGDSIENTDDLNGRNIKTQDTIQAFLQNPIFGSLDTKIGGHNYWIDMLAKYGILGIIFYITFFYRMCKKCLSCLSEEMKTTYFLCLISVSIMAFAKNCKGIEYWLFLFFLIPSFLKYIETYTKRSTL